MKRSYFLYTNGTLKRKDNTITFINEQDEKRDIPIEMIDDFYVMSEMNFNTKFINYISQFGIPIHFFNYYTFYTGSFYPREMNVSGQLLVKQVEHYTNPQKRIEIAREFIEGASFNIYRNLRYYNGRGKDLKFYMEQIEELRRQLNEVTNVEELMGYEGNIRKIYYEAWNIIVNQEIDFEKRVKDLKEEGYEIIEVSIPNILDALATYYIIAPAEASSNLSRYDGMRFCFRENHKNIQEIRYYLTSKTQKTTIYE